MTESVIHLCLWQHGDTLLPAPILYLCQLSVLASSSLSLCIHPGVIKIWVYMVAVQRGYMVPVWGSVIVVQEYMITVGGVSDCRREVHGHSGGGGYMVTVGGYLVTY